MNCFLFGGLDGISPVVLPAPIPPSDLAGASGEWVNFIHKMYGQYFPRDWAIVDFLPSPRL